MKVTEIEWQGETFFRQLFQVVLYFCVTDVFVGEIVEVLKELRIVASAYKRVVFIQMERKIKHGIPEPEIKGVMEVLPICSKVCVVETPNLAQFYF